jgi:hypothetical protein
MTQKVAPVIVAVIVVPKRAQTTVGIIVIKLTCGLDLIWRNNPELKVTIGKKTSVWKIKN